MFTCRQCGSVAREDIEEQTVGNCVVCLVESQHAKRQARISGMFGYTAQQRYTEHAKQYR